MKYQKTKLINENGILYLEYPCEKCGNISIIKFAGPKVYLCQNCKEKFRIVVSKITFKKR